MELPSVISARARGLALALQISIDSDAENIGQSVPILMPLDDDGRPIIHITGSDIDFYRWKIDHVRQDYHVIASRIISMVMPGYHTNLAYFPKCRVERTVEIHRGVGYLILGHSPRDGEDFSTTIYTLNPEVTRKVSIPPGHFFTLEAASWSEVPLVVSELFKIQGGGELDSEIYLEPGQQFIETPEGPIEIPEDFSEGIFT